VPAGRQHVDPVARPSTCSAPTAWIASTTNTTPRLRHSSAIAARSARKPDCQSTALIATRRFGIDQRRQITR
jgi:hypothetical protein